MPPRLITKKKPRVDLMLDSGAFGAWKRGKVIDLASYIGFVQQNVDYFFSYVNVDVIPGRLGLMVRNQSEIEDSAKKSYDNLKIMHKAGLKPIPVFHQGERWYWLERMLAEGEQYIGISPYLRSNYSALIGWLDQCFTLITNEKGQPLCKTHGFGVTDQSILMRYPWFSCDSTSWTMGPSYGHIPVPIYRDGKPDYAWHAQRIIISDKPQKTTKLHYDALGPLEQENVRRFLEEECQITILDARYDPNLRRRAYLRFYQQLIASIKCPRFQHRRASMHAQISSKLKPQGPWPIKLIFATSPAHGQYADLFTKVGAFNRLISYWDIIDENSGLPRNGVVDRVREMILTGLHSDWKGNEWPTTSIRDWNETYRIFRIFRQAYKAGIVPHEHNRFTQGYMADVSQKRRVPRKAPNGRTGTSSD
jgi:hypothetical protein